MAKGHIHHTTLTEGLHVVNLLTNGITILNAQHDGTLALLFQSPEVIRSVGNIHRCAVLGSHFLNLGENLVGFGGGILQRRLIPFLLLQIGNHNGGIKVSFCHLVEVNQNLGVT